MSDCIEWTGARHPNQYGVRKVKGRNQLVHRLAWEEANGPIPAGMVIMHTCDNPPCYNLDHLRLGSQADNLKDRDRKGHGVVPYKGVTHCKRGHEFSSENTHIGTRGKRNCRACGRIRDSIRKKKREEAP